MIIICYEQYSYINIIQACIYFLMFEQYVIYIFLISVNCRFHIITRMVPIDKKKKPKKKTKKQKEKFKETEGKEHDSSQNWAL